MSVPVASKTDVSQIANPPRPGEHCAIFAVILNSTGPRACAPRGSPTACLRGRQNLRRTCDLAPLSSTDAGRAMLRSRSGLPFFWWRRSLVGARLFGRTMVPCFGHLLEFPQVSSLFLAPSATASVSWDCGCIGRYRSHELEQPLNSSSYRRLQRAGSANRSGAIQSLPQEH
jgi:hypothetical protein